MVKANKKKNSRSKSTSRSASMGEKADAEGAVVENVANNSETRDIKQEKNAAGSESPTSHSMEPDESETNDKDAVLAVESKEDSIVSEQETGTNPVEGPVNVSSVNKESAPSTDVEVAPMPTSPKGAYTKGKSVSGPRNKLSALIPGYTAPMKLVTSLDALRKPAAKSKLPPPSFTTSTSFKTGKRPKVVGVNEAGAGWFGMRGTPITEEVKQDLALIRNRNYLDPKRFYKSSDAPSTTVQVGTVIEGLGEFYSSRLTKKQRKATLVQEVMADPATATYAQQKYRKMQQEKGKAGLKRKQQQRKFSKKR